MVKVKMEILNPDINYGLSDKEVKRQIKKGLVNEDTTIPTKSVSLIILSNVFTLFNLLNFFLAFLIYLVGSYKNLLFLGVVFSNTIISIFQEIRAKREVDKLKLTNAPQVVVVRNGIEEIIAIDNIVLDDIVKLKLGNQVVVDSIILDGVVEVNEAFITGESNTIVKKKGDTLYSGSFIVSGKCTTKVIHIGKDNYTSKISKEAKYIKKVNSIILDSLNKIIKILSIIILPLGCLLFFNQCYGLNNSFDVAIVNTVAALISMIPEGLVLLTSTVLAVSVIRLSKEKVLVKQLFSIETLARIDTICFDKTGTLTEGKMNVKKIISINKRYNLEEIMNNLCNVLETDNATMKALKKYFNKKVNIKVKEIIPFSSERKYSEVTFANGDTYRLGAPEILLENFKNYQDDFDEYRCIALVKVSKKVIPLGYILLEDVLRKDTANTIKYFQKQGVDIKIISGDNPKMIVKLLKRLNIKVNNYVDCSKILDKDLEECVLDNNIFGRVSPFQKREIVKILKKHNRIVSFVGDGVNDVLALKESDCSIALACGSEAAYNVSDLVLLDSQFSSVPKIVSEGRRTIHNIERSASLFIVKTGYAVLLTLLFMILPFKYPFIPIQISLTGVLTIGIPSFILALEPNDEIIKGNFLTNIFKKALPTSLIIVLNILIITILPISEAESSTLSVLIVGFIGFAHIYRICKPLKQYHIIMLVILITIFLTSVISLKELFSLTVINTPMLILISILLGLCILEFYVIDLIQNQDKE